MTQYDCSWYIIPLWRLPSGVGVLPGRVTNKAAYKKDNDGDTDNGAPPFELPLPSSPPVDTTEPARETSLRQTRSSAIFSK